MKNPWKPAEIIRLKKIYGSIPTREVGRIFGRSARAVQAKANRLGLDAYAADYDLVEVVKRIYPTSPSRKVCAEFLGITEKKLNGLLARHGISKITAQCVQLYRRC